MRNQLKARDSELSVLKDVRQQLQDRDSELKEAQEEAELVLLQFHLVQVELEKFFLQNQTLNGELNELREVRNQLKARDSELNELREVRNQLKARDSELSELREVRNQLKARDSELSVLKDVRQQLQDRDSELKEAQEEAELVLLQFHLVQEELEHYFLENRKMATSQNLTPKQLEQLQRIKQRLIQQLKASPTKDNPALTQIVRRQQNALRRFQHLHQNH